MDSAAWDERYAGTELIWSTGPNQFVEQGLADLSPGRALDLACGEGRNARWLAQRGWQVTAMDFSPVAIDKGRRLTEQVDDGIDWQVGDVLTAELPSGLDLVVIAYLQIPASERATAIRRSFEALAPGGTLFVVAHDSTNLTEGSGGPSSPDALYTAQDVLDYLGDSAYEVARAERVGREVPADDDPEETLTAWDALVQLTRA